MGLAFLRSAVLRDVEGGVCAYFFVLAKQGKIAYNRIVKVCRYALLRFFAIKKRRIADNDRY